MRKGCEIRFVKGTFEGERGWMDADKAETPEWYWVIVRKNNAHPETPTHVMKTSVRIVEKNKTPGTYAEAVLDQNPDIECKVENLCRSLAKCKIYQDADGIVAIIQQRLDAATRKQTALGSKGTYRHVEFDESSTGNQPSRKRPSTTPTSKSKATEALENTVG
jgi:hypothetical protein